jgi:hypothetical protein
MGGRTVNDLTVAVENRPSWLGDDHELPHPPADVPLWSENYLTYTYAPAPAVGVYFHLRRLPDTSGPQPVWDAVTYISLPDNRFLVSKTFAPLEMQEPSPTGGRGALRIGGLEWRCEQPFARWTMRLRGAARLVTGEELWAGPLQDGQHVGIDVELDVASVTPPWDYGTDELQSAFAKRHYAQHHHATGTLRYGDQTIAIAGSGLRDHSWGPRDLSKIGHTWIHGRVPETGRAFCITYIPERAPYPKLDDPKVADASAVYHTETIDPPVGETITEALEDCEFKLKMPDGRWSTVRCQVITTLPMHFVAPSEFVVGAAAGRPGETHDYLPSFARIEWDGRVGYGYSERCVRRSP